MTWPDLGSCINEASTHTIVYSSSWDGKVWSSVQLVILMMLPKLGSCCMTPPNPYHYVRDRKVWSSGHLDNSDRTWIMQY